MLDIFPMLGNHGRRNLQELLSQLWYEFRADQIFNRLLLLRLGMNIDVKLRGVSTWRAGVQIESGSNYIRRTHLPLYHGRLQVR